MIKLIVFLGNPTKEYERTRHNAGYILANELYSHLSWQNKFHSFYAKDDKFIYLKPLTYMNNSGIAISEAFSFFKLKSDEILVCHDDLELALGRAKIQLGGGLQGHNGLRSIKERVGSDRFYRLRLGIGRPTFNDVRVYVTSNFLQDEEILLKQLIGKCQEYISPDLKAPQEISII